MSRSRHFRRILAAGVVASVSLTWGAGVAFAHESPPPINQSNNIGVEQTGCGGGEPRADGRRSIRSLSVVSLMRTAATTLR